MICSYLLHGYDIIQILKVCIRNEADPFFLCSLRMRMTSDLCNKYEQTTTSYILSVLELTYPKPEKE